MTKTAAPAKIRGRGVPLSAYWDSALDEKLTKFQNERRLPFLTEAIDVLLEAGLKSRRKIDPEERGMDRVDRTIYLTLDRLKQVDDYRYGHRVPSRLKALRGLLLLGLERLEQA